MTDQPNGLAMQRRATFPPLLAGPGWHVIATARQVSLIATCRRRAHGRRTDDSYCHLRTDHPEEEP